MLSLNILPICKARAIDTPFAFLRRNGFTHNTAHQIVAGHVTLIKFAHLERLCILLRCQPHDLLEWRPKDEQPKDIPLAALIPKSETGFEWMGELSNLPLAELRALGKVVKGEVGK